MVEELVWQRMRPGKEIRNSPNYRCSVDEEMRDAAEERRILWHYTNVEALLKIIAKRTLRFSRLDCVNDLVEKELLSYKEYYLRTFVACFTHCDRESIPLWRMYTAPGQGVRIEFEFDESFHVHYSFIKEPNETIISDDGRKAYFLKRVTDIFYSNEKIVSPVSTSKNGDIVEILFDRIGYTKKVEWQFEEETRAVVFLKYDIGIDLPKTIDFNLDFTKLKAIRIVFDPWMSDELEKSIELGVNHYLGEFAYLVSFSESKLRGTIRL